MKRRAKTLQKCFSDFKEALAELKELVEEARQEGQQEKYEQKTIRAFELTHELSLDTMSEYLKNQGRAAYKGSRNITVDAFHENLIDDGEGWLDMIIIRIKMSPLYSEDATKPLYKKIASEFIGLFENFERNLQEKLEEN